MAKIELSYLKGEEIYVCSECGKRVYEEFVDAFLHDDEDIKCYHCGEVITDIDV